MIADAGFAPREPVLFAFGSVALFIADVPGAAAPE